MTKEIRNYPFGGNSFASYPFLEIKHPVLEWNHESNPQNPER